MTPSGEVSCGIRDASGIGYPIVLGEQCAGDYCPLGIHPLNLLLNLIIFYPLACVLFLVAKRIAMKRG